MSTIPDLEAALDAAAHRHYGRRRIRLPWRPVMPAVALACGIAAVVVTVPERAAGPALERPALVTVPPATLALSLALTQKPDPPRFDPRTAEVIPHERLAAVAAEYEREMPYPPGLADDFDWAGTPPGPSDMGSINYRNDVRTLIEHRAGCVWLRYWLLSHAAGDLAARRDATTVLADVPKWPMIRANSGARWSEVAGNAASADVAALSDDQRTECRGA